MFRKAGGELVEARQDVVEGGEGREGVAGSGRAGEVGGRERQFRHHTRMVEGEEPRAVGGFRSQPDGALGRGRAEGRPAFLFPQHPAETMLPGGLVALLADNEGLGRCLCKMPN